MQEYIESLAEICSVLRERVAPYDPADTLASLGGLALIPDNAASFLRLEAAAHATASLPFVAGKPSIKPHRLEALLNSRPVGPSKLSVLDDPQEQPFTDVLAFNGKLYVVFLGRDLEALAKSRHLFAAVCSDRQSNSGNVHWRDFAEAASKEIRAVLSLSDAIAKKAGLTRGLFSLAKVPSQVVVPSSEDFQKLGRAVRFSSEEIEAWGWSQQLDATALLPLTQDQGDEDLDEFAPHDFGLLDRPLIRTGTDELVVALPHYLLGALRARIAGLATRFGVSSDLAERFHEVVRIEVAASLEQIGAVPHADGQLARCSILGPHNKTPSSIGLYNIDRDKALCLLLFTYNFEVRSPQTDRELMWLERDTQTAIGAWIERTEAVLRTASDAVGDILFLCVVQAPGAFSRPHFPGRHPSNSPYLCLTQSELELFAGMDEEDVLSLYEFAKDRASLLSSATSGSTHIVDELLFWCSREHAYPALDTDAPWALVLDSNQSALWRKQALAEADIHDALDAKSGRSMRVHRLDAEIPRLPIYNGVAEQEGCTAHELLVEMLPLPLWFKAEDWERISDNDEELRRADYDYSLLLARAAAFWVCRLSAEIHELLKALAEGFANLTISFARRYQVGARPFKSEISRAQRRVNIVLTPDADAQFFASDNRGERLVISMIIKSMGKLLPDGHPAVMNDVQISKMVDKHLPLGPAKRVLLVNTALIPVLNGENAPPPRFLQPAWMTRIKRAVGACAIDFLGEGDKTATGTRAKKLLNAAVAHLYERLKKTVADLSSDGLLELHLCVNESLLQADSFLDVRVPALISIFGKDSEAFLRSRRWAHRRTIAATASRFVLEYLAACPPEGNTKPSIRAQDELLALGAEIFELGVESDLINAGLAKFELHVNAQGLLSSSDPLYAAAMNEYRAGLALVAATSVNERSLIQSDNVTSSSFGSAGFDPRIERAMQAEAGLTFTELTTFMQAVHRLGQNIAGDAKSMVRREFCSALKEILTWSDSQVDRATDYLSLRPRPDFLNPDGPFRKEDVPPWRYNRALSYLRRPILLRGNAAEEVLWGNRQMVVAAGFLHAMCESGMFPARTKPGEEEMGRVRNDFTLAFENEVANWVKKDDRFQVRHRVTRFGSLQLKRSHEDLGDIDVLVIDVMSHSFWLLECKAISLGRVPHELRNEIEDFFGEASSDKSIIERHSRRRDWCRKHLADMVEAFGLDVNHAWKVDALIVTKERLFTPNLRASALKVVCFEDIFEIIQP